MTVLYVAFGGALGAVLRYGAVIGTERLTGRPLPWGTLAVNVVGSFALGFLLLAADRADLPDDFRRFAAVGVLGAFTTFSAFSWEIGWFLKQDEWLKAVVYAAVSVLLGVAALLAGSAAAAAIVAPRG